MPSVSNHPEVECPPDFCAALQFSQSESGQPLVVPIIGSTFEAIEEQPDRSSREPTRGQPYWRIFSGARRLQLQIGTADRFY